MCVCSFFFSLHVFKYHSKHILCLTKILWIALGYFCHHLYTTCAAHFIHQYITLNLPLPLQRISCNINILSWNFFVYGTITKENGRRMRLLSKIFLQVMYVYVRFRDLSSRPNVLMEWSLYVWNLLHKISSGCIKL